ncbi:MAG: DNA translocase FtsK 4TM domain-containing protein, partial [Maritimibacter sp.]|nr:DNA translocase FtsK 4TM domain-containing protein [Maritimibacter sp.]
MAYQAKGRDPIFDRTTQALIERRGKELVGLALIALATGFAMLIWSYSPDDPGLLAATEGPTRNLLGPLGAAIASPLAVVIGKGAWGIVVGLAGWGLRFVTHVGEERVLARALFVPIAIAFGAVFASTFLPGAGWSHAFGLGGLFGDTVLGALLALFPGSPALGLKLLTVVFFVATLFVGGFALGVNMRELSRAGRYVLGGTVLVYAGVLKLAGSGLRGVARGAMAGAATGVHAVRSQAAERRADRLARAEARADDAGETFAAPPPLKVRRAHLDEPPVSRGAAPEAAHMVEPAQRPGLLARVSGLARRGGEDAGAAGADPALNATRMAGDSDRISAKIANALNARSAPPAGAVAPKTEPVSAVSAAIARAAARGQGPEGVRQEPPVLRQATPPQDIDPIWEPDLEADLGPDDDPYADMPAPVRAVSPPADPEPKRVVQHDTRRVVKSTRAIREAQPALNFGDNAPAFELPPLNLLADPGAVERHHLSDEALEENARMLETVLDDYGVKGEIVSVRPGPVVTMYELEPAPGLKASRVIGLADDIARSMSALSARVSTVPGRSVIGIELPNAHREKVVLREILSARDYGDSNMRLPLALGKDIGGGPVVANLAKMPHLLIAGTTGSGKSVAINTMILSLLYRLTPEECRL